MKGHASNQFKTNDPTTVYKIMQKKLQFTLEMSTPLHRKVTVTVLTQKATEWTVTFGMDNFLIYQLNNIFSRQKKYVH